MIQINMVYYEIVRAVVFVVLYAEILGGRNGEGNLRDVPVH